MSSSLRKHQERKRKNKELKKFKEQFKDPEYIENFLDRESKRIDSRLNMLDEDTLGIIKMHINDPTDKIEKKNMIEDIKGEFDRAGFNEDDIDTYRGIILFDRTDKNKKLLVSKNVNLSPEKTNTEFAKGIIKYIDKNIKSFIKHHRDKLLIKQEHKISNGSDKTEIDIDEDDNLPKNWNKAITEDGRPYYYNREKMISMWHKPSRKKTKSHKIKTAIDLKKAMNSSKKYIANQSYRGKELTNFRFLITGLILHALNKAYENISRLLLKIKIIIAEISNVKLVLNHLSRTIGKKNGYLSNKEISGVNQNIEFLNSLNMYVNPKVTQYINNGIDLYNNHMFKDKKNFKLIYLKDGLIKKHKSRKINPQKSKFPLRYSKNKTSRLQSYSPYRSPSSTLSRSIKKIKTI